MVVFVIDLEGSTTHRGHPCPKTTRHESWVPANQGSSTGKGIYVLFVSKLETHVNYLDLVIGMKVILFVLCAMFIYVLLKIVIVLSGTTQLHATGYNFPGLFSHNVVFSPGRIGIAPQSPRRAVRRTHEGNL